MNLTVMIAVVLFTLSGKSFKYSLKSSSVSRTIPVFFRDVVWLEKYLLKNCEGWFCFRSAISISYCRIKKKFLINITY